jgi:DNA (cytosine-5)-methyltransferase 1
MLSNQYILDINDELIIDNFAGGGGASTGIELALGRHVDIAINHDPKAVAMHTVNHPQTKHYCESVWDVNPREVSQGRPIGLVWLSPDCKHFSKAKGGKPVEKKIRGLAWVALKWASLPNKPRVIMLENVEEFVTWGPLGQDGKPCKKNKGREFKSFVNALKKHGYAVEWKELRACDFGAPTIRRRLFLIARCDGIAIQWPAQTHFDPVAEAKRKKMRGEKMRPTWRTAAECIDWTIPCPSIFERSKPLAEATNRRIAKGMMKYVINNHNPFIITTDRPITNRSLPRGMDQPLPTATGAQRIAVVAPFISEHANASNQRNMPVDEPLRTQCAQVKGGHFSIVAPVISTYYGEKTGNEVRGANLNSPLHTQTTENRHSLVTGFLAKHYTGAVGSDFNQPIGTITTIDHHSEVRAFLIKYYGTDGDIDMAEPLHTITTKDRFGLVTVKGELYQIVDIGLRMLAPKELFKAQGFPDTYIIEHGVDPQGNTIKMTKTEQVRMVGNSVCPPLAAALVKANLPELVALNQRAAA